MPLPWQESRFRKANNNESCNPSVLLSCSSRHVVLVSYSTCTSGIVGLHIWMLAGDKSLMHCDEMLPV